MAPSSLRVTLPLRWWLSPGSTSTFSVTARYTAIFFFNHFQIAIPIFNKFLLKFVCFSYVLLQAFSVTIIQISKQIHFTAFPANPLAVRYTVI